jgi:hypothetical protein
MRSRCCEGVEEREKVQNGICVTRRKDKNVKRNDEI